MQGYLQIRTNGGIHSPHLRDAVSRVPHAGWAQHTVRVERSSRNPWPATRRYSLGTALAHNTRESSGPHSERHTRGRHARNGAPRVTAAPPPPPPPPRPPPHSPPRRLAPELPIGSGGAHSAPAQTQAVSTWYALGRAGGGDRPINVFTSRGYSVPRPPSAVAVQECSRYPSRRGLSPRLIASILTCFHYSIHIALVVYSQFT